VLRVLLDTNAINNLFRSPLGPMVRRALRFLVRHRRVEILLTTVHLAELAGMDSDAHRTRLTREMIGLSGGRVLRSYHDRARDEIRFGRPLRRREALHSRRASVLLMRVVHSNSLAADVREQANSWKEQLRSIDDHGSTHYKTTSDLQTDFLRWRRSWEASRQQLIGESAQQSAYKLLRELNLQIEPSPIFDFSRRAPSIWYQAAFHLARERFLIEGAIKRHPSDLFDGMHFSDAAYAEILVTSDRGLAKVAAEVDLGERLRVLDFVSFANELAALRSNSEKSTLRKPRAGTMSHK
jgi:hypothetical protein